jgi:hypothetical protein
MYNMVSNYKHRLSGKFRLKMELVILGIFMFLLYSPLKETVEAEVL